MTETGSEASRRLVTGRYRLTRMLGRGGMGVVWQATDELIGREVAVKEIRPPHGLAAQERAVFGQRALREARTAGRVNHPVVIAIHDLVTATAEDDAVYIVMELVDGHSLADVLEREGALPERRVARIGLRVLDALDAAHAIGLVHRDVKPSNIMLLADDEVKLVDFGIAHAVDDTRLTRQGVTGSTRYMAPELFEGKQPSPAVDLWSLGATLYHAVQGSGPFDRPSTAATIHAILHEDLPPLDHHLALAPLITGLLTREPTRRITSQPAADLLQTAATRPPTTPQAPTQHTAEAYGSGQQIAWEEQPTATRSGVAPLGANDQTSVLPDSAPPDRHRQRYDHVCHGE